MRDLGVVADPILFRDLAYVFVAAILGGSLAWLARQPLILGYVIGGLLISPLTPGPSVSDVHTFELFAEIGVVLLMFSLGIEFSLKDLMGVKWVALVGGPIGIVLSTAMGSASAVCSAGPPVRAPSSASWSHRPARWCSRDCSWTAVSSTAATAAS